MRAEAANRSLQQELLRILTQEASRSVTAFAAEIRKRQAAYGKADITFPDSAAAIRADRDQR